MDVSLSLIGVWIGLVFLSVCQSQRSSMTNPLQQLAGNIKFCGQTQLHLNAANRVGFRTPGLPQGQQPQSQVYQDPSAYARGQQPPANPRGQAVFGFQASRPYMNRVKRQAMGQQPNYQSAFIPDLSRMPQGQQPYMPPQTYQQQQTYLQQQQQIQPGLYPQQRFLSPQRAPPGHHAEIQNLLLALDPPDPPDMPDFFIRTTPSPWSQPGRALPQPGPQLNKPTAANVNAPGPQMFQPPAPPPPSPPQFFSPPINNPAQGAMSPQSIQNIANLPVLRGIDTICFCTDSSTCVLLEGNLEHMFGHQCSVAPPPNIPPPRTTDVCCCMG